MLSVCEHKQLGHHRGKQRPSQTATRVLFSSRHLHSKIIYTRKTHRWRQSGCPKLYRFAFQLSLDANKSSAHYHRCPRRKFRLRLVLVEKIYYMWHYPRLRSTFIPKALLQRHVITGPQFSTPPGAENQ